MRRSAVNSREISTNTDLRFGCNESLFSCRFPLAEFFFCALSHAPTHSSPRSLESGADLKWSGWTLLSPRKTKQCVRIPKPAGDVRKTWKWGQQIALSNSTSEGVTGGRKGGPPLKTIKLSEKFRRKRNVEYFQCWLRLFGGCVGVFRGRRKVGLGPDF